MIRTALLFALACTTALSAADLTGRWIAEFPGPNGDKRQFAFSLRTEGDSLSGFVTMPIADEPFSGGKINGNEFVFAVTMRTPGGDRRMEYKGRLEGEQIVLTMPGFRNGPPREVVARRMSTDPGKPKTLADLPQVKLPALHPLRDNGLARTPPMGWNSWNFFHQRIDDKTVREIADAMVKTGMRDAGYIYVNIDDTWEADRDEKGFIRTNQKFPDMKALADYVHSKGLKLGIYSSPGPKTCAGYEGSYAHEEQDAKTYASWGIDYLKYDWCSAERVFKHSDMQAVYQKMGEALQASGRPIVYSLCQYGLEKVQEWGPAVGGNLWRTTGDIGARWQSLSSIGFERQAGLEKYAGPGHWNDPDMLEVGNPGLTDVENRTHMALWAILAAPLLAGNDIRNMSQDTLAILTNPEVIAIDQDKLGKQGYRIKKDGTSEIWMKPLEGGDVAVGLFNRGESPAKIEVKWEDVGIKTIPAVRNLWTREDIGKSAGGYAPEVAAHGVALLRLKP